MDHTQRRSCELLSSGWVLTCHVLFTSTQAVDRVGVGGTHYFCTFSSDFREPHLGHSGYGWGLRTPESPSGVATPLIHTFDNWSSI